MNQKEAFSNNGTSKFSSTKEGVSNTPFTKPQKWQLILLGVGVVIALIILTAAGIYLALSMV